MLKPKRTITSSTKGRRKVKLNPDKKVAGHTKTIALTPAQKRKMASKPKPDKQEYVLNKEKKSGKLKHKVISKKKYDRKRSKYAKKGETLGTTTSIVSQTIKKGNKKSVSRVNTTELAKTPRPTLPKRPRPTLPKRQIPTPKRGVPTPKRGGTVRKKKKK